MGRHLPELTRGQQAGGLVMSALALVCCFVPGFNSLGYFSALIMGAVGSTAGLTLGALEAHRARRSASSSHAQLWAAARSAWVLLLPPLLILSAAAIFVPNCDLMEGASFYVMSAGLGVVFATQIGAACAILLRGAGRGAIAALFVGAMWTLRDCYHLYTDPPIFVYNPFFGFFSGAIYDDVIAIDNRFIWFRIASAVQLVWLGSFIHLGWHDGGWSIAALRAQGVRSRTRSWVIFALLSFLCGGLYGARGTIGYEIDQRTIEAELGGRLESDTITLIYDEESNSPAQAERLMWDARFRLSQLSERLDEDSIEPFTLFLYSSADQKRRLMGARRVQLAKPWLRQAHIHNSAYGDKTLAHEMAHVVLGAYSAPPLYVPAKWGGFVNAGILEGAAVALEPASGRFNVHEKSAAMRRLGLAPDLQVLLGPEGFWTQSAARSYTLTGSFLRWLHTTRGSDAFKSVYRTANFSQVYGEELESLISAWEDWVDEQTISEEVVAWADSTYRGVGVLHRICPLEIARLNDSAGRLLEAGDRAKAITVLEEVVAHLPNDPYSLLQLAAVKAQTETPAVIDALISNILSVDDLPLLIRVRFEELQADARWRKGDVEEAGRRYGNLAQLPLAPAHARLMKLKRDVCQDRELEPVYGPYLLGGARDAQVDLVYLTEAAADLSQEPIATYLLGRRTLQTGDAKNSIGPLKTSLTLLEDDQTRGSISLDTARAVEAETWRLLGHALLNTGSLLDSEAAFARASQLATTSEERATNLDWAARSSWLRTHPDLREHSVF